MVSRPDCNPINSTTRDIEERFSLGGAAHKSLREDSYAGIRAGERKTCWANPLPPALKPLSGELAALE
jgi:hypothetical protein